MIININVYYLHSWINLLDLRLLVTHTSSVREGMLCHRCVVPGGHTTCVDRINSPGTLESFIGMIREKFGHGRNFEYS